MIINRQFQHQKPIFSPLPRHEIPFKKSEHRGSVLDSSICKERREARKSNIKRLSCHSISRESQVLMEKPSFNNNKILDHILKHIKENYKQSIKQKEGKDGQASNKNQEGVYKMPDPHRLNFQKNLKIKSINGLIKRKEATHSFNRTAKTPFMNRKINHLRKGKSYTLYTQEVETEDIEEAHQGKILPWDDFSNHIYKFPGTNQEEDQSIEENYLKSHNLRLHEEKSIPKCNTLVLDMQDKAKPPSFKRHSQIEVSQGKQKPKDNSQMFSATCFKPRGNKLYMPKQRRKDQVLNRTLTEMKVQLQDIQLQKVEAYQPKSIKVQQFFHYTIPKTANSRKHPPLYQQRHPQSFRKEPATDTFPSNFIMSGKGL